MKFVLTSLFHFGLCLTSPILFSSAERNFSTLKLIETFNRPHMRDSRKSSLAMLCVEASCVRSLDLDDVIKAFACQKTRSKRL